MHQLTSTETQRAASALLLLSPAIPMLFMGEEFCCENPFQFFVDFGDKDLRTAVVEGRKREYPQHDWSKGMLPTDAAAFHDSKIGSALNGDREMRAWYRDLLTHRKRWIVRGILQQRHMVVDSCIDKGIFVLRYRTAANCVTVAARLSSSADSNDICDFSAGGELIMDSCPDRTSLLQLLPNHAKIFLQHLT